jgi:hypothetical protein
MGVLLLKAASANYSIKQISRSKTSVLLRLDYFQLSFLIAIYFTSSKITELKMN